MSHSTIELCRNQCGQRGCVFFLPFSGLLLEANDGMDFSSHRTSNRGPSHQNGTCSRHYHFLSSLNPYARSKFTQQVQPGLRFCHCSYGKSPFVDSVTISRILSNQGGGGQSFIGCCCHCSTAAVAAPRVGTGEHPKLVVLV